MVCTGASDGWRSSDAQGELSALEKGMHALHSGMDVKAYAASVGRARTTVHAEVYAAEVATVVPDIGNELTKHFAKLVEIHAAPQWLWPALVQWMAGAPATESGKEIKPWTVEQTRAMVARLKDAPEKLPEWFSDDTPANLIEGASRVRDVAA
jgi:hypothetical protein